MYTKNPLNILLLCLLIPTLLSAQAGDCVFFSTSGDKFHIALDNKFQNATANANVKVQNVPEGDYWITVLFDDANKKAFKSNVRIMANKETSFKVEQEGGNWKLNEYSSVPKSQVKTLAGQTTIAYTRTGVEVKGLKSADQMSNDMVHAKTEINRVQGMREDPASKRMGRYNGSGSISGEGDAAAAAPAPKAAPETGTTTTSEYVKLENADGTTSIVEERTTVVKEIVDRSGQKQLRTKKNKMQYPTDFNCLPMQKEQFLALKASVEGAAQEERSMIAQKGVKDQCMTPGQLKALGDLILSEVDRNNFAVAAKPTCADPKKFPFVLTEPIAAVENEKTVTDAKESVMITKEEVEEKEEVVEEKPKTKAELKAELKALKLKEKEAKKAAKAKAKAEKLAAKKKAKEEKLAAKAAAKKAKEEAKKGK